jgi:hypothetical protein
MAAAPASAHSRKDLKRITLQSPTLVVDQIAFYFEPYVNKRVDEEGRKYRYQLWEFEKIDLKGDRAEIHVLVNDQKAATRTPEVLYLVRNPDNTWNHVTEDGTVIEERIFSFVNKDGSISSGGHSTEEKAGAQSPARIYAMAGGVVVAGVLALVMVRRRKAVRH